jgi:hypothetical protein
MIVCGSGIISMTPLLRGIPNLCHLDCGDNHIGDTGAAALAEFISRSFGPPSPSTRERIGDSDHEGQVELGKEGARTWDADSVNLGWSGNG